MSGGYQAMTGDWEWVDVGPIVALWHNAPSQWRSRANTRGKLWKPVWCSYVVLPQCRPT